MTFLTTTDGGPSPVASDPSRPPLIIDLVPGPGGVHSPPRPRQHWLRAAILFALTFFTTTTLGAQWAWWIRTDVEISLGELGIPLLSLSSIAQVWGDPELLATGLQFSLPTLLILLAHELGHYLACRRYRIDSTLPYFLPAPIVFGTFGAFIRLRSPLKNRRELFDVGAAGPIAGFVVLLPFLIYGIAHSQPAAAPPATAASDLVIRLTWLGDNLGFALLSRLFHGPLPETYILNLHPFAIATWFGMLATALNLLPLSQLDGGHILYAVAGARQRQLALPLWLGVALLSLYWPGWLLWAAITLLLGLSHPPVGDEREPLDGKRKVLAVASLLILALCISPLPFHDRLVDARALPLLNPPAAGGQIAAAGALDEPSRAGPGARSGSPRQPEQRTSQYVRIAGWPATPQMARAAASFRASAGSPARRSPAHR